MDKRKISLVIVTHNEYIKLLESFDKVVHDDRISEVIILDDHSDEEITYRIEQWYEYDAHEKVKLAQNIKHIGTEISMRNAIVLADSEYVLCVNSANTIVDKWILDRIYEKEWTENDKLEMVNGGYLVNRDVFLRDFELESK